MYVIKMGADKALVTTIHSTIYQGEKNSDTLVFILPRKYEDVSISDCTMLLRYILPNGIGRSEEIEMYPLPHNDDYYQYRLKANTRFTAMHGTIELWLTVLSLTDEILLKTDATTIEITPTKDITDYLPPEELNQIDSLTLKVNRLEREKADDLSYDEKQRLLQLTSRGNLIGHAVDLGRAVEDMEFDDVIHFGDADVDEPIDDDGVIHFGDADDEDTTGTGDDSTDDGDAPGADADDTTDTDDPADTGSSDEGGDDSGGDDGDGSADVDGSSEDGSDDDDADGDEGDDEGGSDSDADNDGDGEEGEDDEDDSPSDGVIYF